MAINILESETGYGLESDIGIYRWHGHAFNPSGQEAEQSWNPWGSWSNRDVNIYNASSSFNLSGFQYGNEVVIYLLRFSTSVTDSGTITITYYDPDDNPLLSYNFDWSYDPEDFDWWGAFVGIGIKDDRFGSREIWENGQYYVEADITYNNGSTHYYTYKFFTVSNQPVLTLVYPFTNVGKIWVDGDELHYICYQGYDMIAKHDGSSSYVGDQHAGKIWIEGNKIAYVDEDGYKRRTKKGALYGNPAGDELPSSPGTGASGSIWVNDWGSDTYLMFVDEYGIKRRVGAGYVFGGDYQ
jgi:hypothetical protein